MQGRDYVVPDDVKFLVRPVYRHRIILKPEAEIEGLNADTAMTRILARVEVHANDSIASLAVAVVARPGARGRRRIE
jgi:hypothetical protein